MIAEPAVIPPDCLTLSNEFGHFFNYDVRVMVFKDPENESNINNNWKIFGVYASNSTNHELFQEELKDLHLLEHPSLNKIVGFGNSNSQFSVFYKEIPFGTLNSCLTSLGITEKMIILYGIASSLNYLHSNNIFFHNLNSKQIFLNRSHEPILDSYGFSCFAPKVSEIPFVAPELLVIQTNDTDNIDLSNVDIYSFGYFIIEVITGTRPTLLRRMSDRYLYSFPNDLPESLKELILNCIKFDPKERSTFSEILKTLSDIINSPSNINEKQSSDDRYFGERFNRELFSSYISKLNTSNQPTFPRKTFKFPNVYKQNTNNTPHVPEIDVPRIRFRFNHPDTARPVNAPPLSAVRHGALPSNSLPLIPFRTFQMQMFSQQETPDVSDVDPNELEQRDDPDAHFILGYYYESKEHDYQKAYFHYKTASAHFNHANAIYRLGLLLMNGKGCTVSMKKASKLFLKAAKQRHSDAAYQFCMLHADISPLLSANSETPLTSARTARTAANSPRFTLNSPRYASNSKRLVVNSPEIEAKSTELETKTENDQDSATTTATCTEEDKLTVVEDLKQCMSYLQYSADIGFTDSIFKLGYLVENGKCFEKDETRAFELYRKAAIRGCTEAQFKCATMLLEGRGTPKVFSDAAFFLQKAARKGHTEASFRCAQLFENGIGVIKNGQKAAEFYREAASKGHPAAKRCFAIMLKDGEHVAKNEKLAFSMMIESANLGDVKALTEIGLMYYEGCGVEVNMKEAFAFYKKAMNNDEIRANVYIGLMYEQGLATGVNPDKATKCFKTAADAKDPLGQFHYARALENGVGGLEKNLLKAATYYRLAANQGYARAQYNVARYLEFGLGIEKDKSLAIQYYKCAAKQGIKAAEKAVRRLRINCL